MRKLLYLLFNFLHLTLVIAVIRPTAITIENNGYKGIMVAVHPSVKESSNLIAEIKKMFTEGSSYLHKATEKRAWFSDVTILVPSSWAPSASWPPATSELYSNADVIIQDPITVRMARPLSEDVDANIQDTIQQPMFAEDTYPKERLVRSVSNSDLGQRSGSYTRSYGGCGQSGVRVNIFTDIFGSRGSRVYGSSGHVLVHEWARFRWGVFNEYAEKGEPQFYFSPSTGQLEVVRCNIHMRGRIYRIDASTHRAVICTDVDPLTGLYNEECLYDVYTRGNFNENITASIMDRIKVPTIVNFCNDDQSNWKQVHNYEAPSRQNRLCGSRSTWAVISDSPDFKGGKNPPRDVPNTAPNFKVVRLPTNKRIVLAMDSSASMQRDGKITSARQAATTFIEDGLHDEEPLGVVSFSSEAQLKAPVKRVGGAERRRAISRVLPKKAEGGTSVGAALLKSIEVLQNDDENVTAAFIIVVTDGQDTAPPYVKDVMDMVTEAGAVVNVIAFSEETPKSLEHLVQATGGRFYFDNNKDISTTAVDALLDTYSALDSGVWRLPVQIVHRADALAKSQALSGSFWMDYSLGKNSRMLVTYVKSAPEVMVISPSGRRYCHLYPEYMHDDSLHRIKIVIPGLAETGKWTYTITNTQSVYEKVTFMVLSSGRDKDLPPLRLSASVLVDNSSWPIRSQLTAEVTRGGEPVTDLTVLAFVDRPMSEPVKLQLFDKGAGADADKNDGIYSRFFTLFTTSGLYSVRVEVIDNEGDALISENLDRTHSHMATAFAGSVRVDHPRLPISNNMTAIDDYPPMRITDLRVLHTSRANGTVVLSWTAPGDDADFDTAAAYTILVTLQAADMTSEKYIPVVQADEIIEGGLKSPRPFGTQEQVTIKLSIPSDQNVSRVFSVFAVDESGNKGELSNLVTVGFGFVPDVNTPEYIKQQQERKVGDEKKVQKLVIIGVLGVFSSLLVLTIVITFIIHLRTKTRTVVDPAFGDGSKNAIV